jgi:hypothetical protein
MLLGNTDITVLAVGELLMHAEEKTCAKSLVPFIFCTIKTLASEVLGNADLREIQGASNMTGTDCV